MPKATALTLNSLCAELGVPSTVAREKLRTASRQPKPCAREVAQAASAL